MLAASGSGPGTIVGGSALETAGPAWPGSRLLCSRFKSRLLSGCKAALRLRTSGLLVLVGKAAAVDSVILQVSTMPPCCPVSIARPYPSPGDHDGGGRRCSDRDSPIDSPVSTSFLGRDMLWDQLEMHKCTRAAF